MKKINQPAAAFAAMAWTIDNRPRQTAEIVKRHGIDLPITASAKDIQKGVSSLLANSKPFRKEFATLVTQKGDGSFASFVSADGDSKAWQDTTAGKVLSSDNISNWINTGLDVWATKQKAKAGGGTQSPSDTFDTSLNYARDMNQGGSGSTQKQPSSGIGTTGIVLLSLGALALIGTVIYFATRKK